MITSMRDIIDTHMPVEPLALIMMGRHLALGVHELHVLESRSSSMTMARLVTSWLTICDHCRNMLVTNGSISYVSVCSAHAMLGLLRRTLPWQLAVLLWRGGWVTGTPFKLQRGARAASARAMSSTLRPCLIWLWKATVESMCVHKAACDLAATRLSRARDAMADSIDVAQGGVFSRRKRKSCACAWHRWRRLRYCTVA